MWGERITILLLHVNGYCMIWNIVVHVFLSYTSYNANEQRFYLYARALFSLFRNVGKYRNLHNLQTLLYTTLCYITLRFNLPWNFRRTRSLENNAFSALHYVIKVTSYYLMLHHFEIHSALELLRTALLCCRLAASSLSEAARWQLPLLNISERPSSESDIGSAESHDSDSTSPR